MNVKKSKNLNVYWKPREMVVETSLDSIVVVRAVVGNGRTVSPSGPIE